MVPQTCVMVTQFIISITCRGLKILHIKEIRKNNATHQLTKNDFHEGKNVKEKTKRSVSKAITSPNFQECLNQFPINGDGKASC